MQSAHAALILLFSALALSQEVTGIDVSHHQGEIDWNKVRHSKIRFVYVKASEGRDLKDSSYRENQTAATRAGLRVGAYHFFTLCRTGLEQAENFLAAVTKFNGMLPPVADVEFKGNCLKRPAPEVFEKDLRGFLDKLETTYGITPILYTTPEFFTAYLRSETLAKYPMWVRQLDGDPQPLPEEIRKRKILIRQVDIRARIPGIRGNVDFNRATEDLLNSIVRQ